VVNILEDKDDYMKCFAIAVCFIIIGCNSLPGYKFIKEYKNISYGFIEEHCCPVKKSK
jgi:hypothetical protein